MGVVVPGNGLSGVWLQQPVYCDDSICVPSVLFDLVAGRGGGGSEGGTAGSLQFVLGGSCSHTQALKQVQALVLGMPFLGALVCKARCGKDFLLLG